MEGEDEENLTITANFRNDCTSEESFITELQGYTYSSRFDSALCI